MSERRATATPRTMIGAYGTWAAGLMGPGPPTHSFRADRWTDVDEWRTAARARLLDRIAQPECGGCPHPRVLRQFTYDGLHVEELEWQLPYGPPTRAVFLKPAGAHGPLPAVLALHDHGGNHYFGLRKITRTSDRPHPDIVRHQELAYGGVGWANRIARRGLCRARPRRLLLRQPACPRGRPARIRRALDDGQGGPHRRPRSVGVARHGYLRVDGVRRGAGRGDRGVQPVRRPAGEPHGEVAVLRGHDLARRVQRRRPARARLPVLAGRRRPEAGRLRRPVGRRAAHGVPGRPGRPDPLRGVRGVHDHVAGLPAQQVLRAHLDGLRAAAAARAGLPRHPVAARAAADHGAQHAAGRALHPARDASCRRGCYAPPTARRGRPSAIAAPSTMAPISSTCRCRTRRSPGSTAGWRPEAAGRRSPHVSPARARPTPRSGRLRSKTETPPSGCPG